LSPFTIGHMLRAGALPCMKIGTLWRGRAANLDAYICEASEAAAAKGNEAARKAKRRARRATREKEAPRED